MDEARRAKNRVSAHESRRRKIAYVKSLEEQVSALNANISYLCNENDSLLTEMHALMGGESFVADSSCVLNDEPRLSSYESQTRCAPNSKANANVPKTQYVCGVEPLPEETDEWTSWISCD